MTVIFLVVQWLGPHASTAEGVRLSLVTGTKIPPAAWCGQEKKKELQFFFFLPLSIFRLFVDFLLGCTFSFQKYREYILTKVYLDSNSMLALEISSVFSSLGTM